MRRSSAIKVVSLAAVLGAAALLLAPRPSLALEAYCCVCTGCGAGASRQCVSVAAIGGFAAECESRCGNMSCQFLEVLEGQCTLHADACTPSPAPATSRPVLFVLTALLAGGGVYLARRRVTH